MSMHRRGFLARLFAAPMVALALFRPEIRPHTEGSFGDWPSVNGETFDADEITQRYIYPAVKALMDRQDAKFMEMLSR